MRALFVAVLLAVSLAAKAAFATAITPGSIIASYTGVTQVNVTGTGATGGTGTYTYQWFRSTSSGTKGSSISGATSFSLADTGLSGATTYYYTLTYGDGVDPTADSAQVSVTTLPTAKLMVVGSVGDSITAGITCSGSETAPADMVNFLNVALNGKWQFVLPSGANRGISGTTTGDWFPGGGDLSGAVTEFNSLGVTFITIMLGTNDTFKTLLNSPATYQSNMQAIVNYLFANVPTLQYVQLFSPPWDSGSTANGTPSNYNDASDGLLLQYAATLPNIADGVKTFFTITNDSFNYFQQFTTPYQCSGLHPNDLGYVGLGAIWANGVMNDPVFVPPGRLIFR